MHYVRCLKFFHAFVDCLPAEGWVTHHASYSPWDHSVIVWILFNYCDLSLRLRNGFDLAFYLTGSSSFLPVLYSKALILFSGCKWWVAWLLCWDDLLSAGTRLAWSFPFEILVICFSVWCSFGELVLICGVFLFGLFVFLFFFSNVKVTLPFQTGNWLKNWYPNPEDARQVFHSCYICNLLQQISED